MVDQLLGRVYFKSLLAPFSHIIHSIQVLPCLLLSIFRHGQHIFNEARHRLPILQELMEPRNSGLEVDVLTLLNQFHYRRACDPRDEVYRILGIHSSIEITPDYYLGITAAYIQPSLQYIQHSGCMRAFSCVFQQNPILGLPSWLPDWSFNHSLHSYANQRWRTKAYNLYKVCGSAFMNQRIYDNIILSVSGVRFGIVSDSSGRRSKDVLFVGSKATVGFERPPQQASISVFYYKISGPEDMVSYVLVQKTMKSGG